MSKKIFLKTTLQSRTGLLGPGYSASRHPSHWWDMADVGQRRGPAVGASEAKGISTDIAEKLANLGTSTGSAFKIGKKCIH